MDISKLRAQRNKVIQDLHPLPPNDPPPAYQKDDLNDKPVKHSIVGDGWLARLDANLRDTDVHLLLDDSGSMFFNDVSRDVQRQYTNSEFKRPDGKPIKTRFDEALTSIYRILPLIQMVETKVTLSFLNSRDVHVANTDAEFEQLKNVIVELCRKNSNGGTPLVGRMREIYGNLQTSNRKHLAILFVDGEPGDYGFEPRNVQRAFDDLVKLFKARKENIFTCIALCTDNEDEVGRYNGLDTDLPRFDVCDDFFSERAEIAKVYRKSNIPMDERMFTYEDYLIKMLIGAIDQEIDRLDE